MPKGVRIDRVTVLQPWSPKVPRDMLRVTVMFPLWMVRLAE